ncbi:hypothetical protein EC950183_4792, partial [Escherichia coli 95.0183]
MPAVTGAICKCR